MNEFQYKPQEPSFIDSLLRYLRPIADYSTSPRFTRPVDNPNIQEETGLAIVLQSLRNAQRGLGYSVKTPGADMFHLDEDTINAATQYQLFKRYPGTPYTPPATPLATKQYGA